MEEQKINFLSTAITDAQELIRFIDTKTAVVITVIGAYIVGVFTSIDKIIKYCDKFSCFFWIVLGILLLVLAFTISITARIIKPTSLPKENIKLDGLNEPELPFYLAPNDYKKDWKRFFINSKDYKLKMSYKDYKEKFDGVTVDKLIDSLAFELLKVSFIRNIKTDRFNQLVFFLLASSACFFLFYVTYSHEISLIEFKLPEVKQCC